MSKKLGWLDSFAEEQAKKMQKTAALNKKAEQVIVNPEEIPGAVNGTEITFQNAKYKVVDASYSDEIGAGVILEKCGCEEEEKQVEAALEDLNKEEPADVPEETPAADPMVMETGAPTPAAGSMGAQEYHYTNPGDVYSIGDVRDQVEPDKFNAEANETAQQIAQENSVDRTVPEGKYSPNRILNRMMDSVVTVQEEVPAEELVEEVVEETPAAEEVPIEEVPVEEEVPTEEVVEEEIPEEEVVEEEVPAEEEVPVEEPVEEVDEEEVPEEEEKKNPFEKNSILSRMTQQKVAKQTKTADNKKIFAVASKINKAVEAEAEEILEHAELAIKQFIPARYVKAALTKIEKALEKEGIEALFDKTITREALRKTASEKPSIKELNEVVAEVTKAVIAEFEDVLEDTDEVANETVAKFDKNKLSIVESKLKATIEKSLAAKGIYAKLERKYKK